MEGYFRLILLFFVAKSYAQNIVTTQYGPIRSANVQLDDGKVIETYLGVPFAQPPLGPLRFLAPQPHTPWTEVIDTNKLRSVCPQNTPGLFVLTHPNWNDTSEDCLHLNLFTPAVRPTEPMAVMVYFHGGGYTGSGNIQYPGHFLARMDVVVVVPNYRLGHLGFISTNDDAAWGNWGMLDQVFALRWVQSNIAEFGGDPNKVTIFGQSAGASSAALHMFSPLSEGLFHQVITESGSDLNIWSVNWPNQRPETYTDQVATALGCPTDDHVQMIECLRDVPEETLRDASITCTPGYFCQGFAPVIDHAGGFLPKTPQEYRLEDNYKKVPMISGICSEDGALYLLPFVPEALLGGFTREEFNRYLRERLVGYFAPRFTNQTVEDIYQALNHEYTPWPLLNDLELNRRALVMLVTDFAFGASMLTQLKDHWKHQQQTYQYIMGFRSSNATGRIPEWMGVPHNGEIPYVFGYGYLTINQAVRDNMQMHFDFIDWNQEDIDYGKFVIELWTNFAKTGNPTPQPVQKPWTDETITWTATNSDTEYNYMNFYREVDIATEYRSSQHAYWLSYMPYVANVSLIPTVPTSGSASMELPILKSDTMEKIMQSYYESLIADKN